MLHACNSAARRNAVWLLGMPKAGPDDPLARHIRAARAYANMSRDQIGNAVGVDGTTVGRWERGEWKKGPPRAAMLREVARITGVPEEFMFSGFVGALALADDALAALGDATPNAQGPTVLEGETPS